MEQWRLHFFLLAVEPGCQLARFTQLLSSTAREAAVAEPPQSPCTSRPSAGILSNWAAVAVSLSRTPQQALQQVFRCPDLAPGAAASGTGRSAFERFAAATEANSPVHWQSDFPTPSNTLRFAARHKQCFFSVPLSPTRPFAPRQIPRFADSPPKE